jgi:hypothetical protein
VHDLENARQPKPVIKRAISCDCIAGISMTHHACCRIVPKHALKPLGSLGCAIGNDHHA